MSTSRYVAILQKLAGMADWLTPWERDFCYNCTHALEQDGEAGLTPAQKRSLEDLEVKYHD